MQDTRALQQVCMQLAPHVRLEITAARQQITLLQIHSVSMK